MIPISLERAEEQARWFREEGRLWPDLRCVVVWPDVKALEFLKLLEDGFTDISIGEPFDPFDYAVKFLPPLDGEPHEAGRFDRDPDDVVSEVASRLSLPSKRLHFERDSDTGSRREISVFYGNGLSGIPVLRCLARQALHIVSEDASDDPLLAWTGRLDSFTSPDSYEFTDFATFHAISFRLDLFEASAQAIVEEAETSKQVAESGMFLAPAKRSIQIRNQCCAVLKSRALSLWNIATEINAMNRWPNMTNHTVHKAIRAHRLGRSRPI